MDGLSCIWYLIHWQDKDIYEKGKATQTTLHHALHKFVRGDIQKTSMCELMKSYPQQVRWEDTISNIARTLRRRSNESAEETVTQPKVVITDEYGTVYEPDESTGVLMRTKGKVSVNENADDMSTVESPSERLKSLLKYYPDYFLGRDVYKEWGGLAAHHKAAAA